MPRSDPQIEELLPHRPPFLFVDRIITAAESGGSVQGLFRVPEDHPFINRSAGQPVFPALLLVEALGQTAALCVRQNPGAASEGERRLGYLVRIDQCTFEHPVYAGATVNLSARLIAGYGPLHKFATRADVSGKLAVEANLTLYIEL